MNNQQNNNNYYNASYCTLRSIETSCALYLSFKRNNGINIPSIFAALLMPEIYIIYSFAVHHKQLY
ncbi:hypothetical protein BMW23_0928 [Bodo saltans virus]|uniref:Transmembrane protein n=1 Tax=Bodo saltans virus TaxID=2024608 RepID=A0A2H4UVM8_9VIRU|nr:hypothetical protein QJ851_gp0910 [Bodo saltans virus]ATZ80973.1 hypothetical protein BMW23_0928 [Bodo saltans virus]